MNKRLIIFITLIVISITDANDRLEAGVDYDDEVEASAFEFQRIKDANKQTLPFESSASDETSSEDTNDEEMTRNHRRQSVKRHSRRSSINYLQKDQLSRETPSATLSREDYRDASPYLQPPPTTESEIDPQLNNWIPVPWIKLLQQASFRRSNPPPIELEMFRPPPPLRQNTIDREVLYNERPLIGRRNANEVNRRGERKQQFNSNYFEDTKRDANNNNNNYESKGDANDDECTCTPKQRYGSRSQGQRSAIAEKELNYKTLDDVLAEVIDDEDSGYRDDADEALFSTPSYGDANQQRPPNINRRNSNEQKMIYKGYIIDTEEQLSMICRQFTSVSPNKYVSPPPPPPKSFLQPSSNIKGPSISGQSYGQSLGGQITTRKPKVYSQNGSKTPTRTPTIDFSLSVTHPSTPTIKWSLNGQGNGHTNPYPYNQWKNQTINGIKRGISKVSVPNVSVSKSYNQQNNQQKGVKTINVPVIKAPIKGVTVTPTSFNENYFLTNLKNQQQQLLASRSLASNKNLASPQLKSGPINVPKVRPVQVDQTKYWNQQYNENNNNNFNSFSSSTTQSTNHNYNNQHQESYQSTHPVKQSTTKIPSNQDHRVMYMVTTPLTVSIDVSGGGVKGGNNGHHGRKSSASKSSAIIVPFYRKSPKDF